MNLQELSDDLIAAINQMYLMDERFPHSNYRVQLVNKLGQYVKLIKRRQIIQNRLNASPATEPEKQAIKDLDLPWD